MSLAELGTCGFLSILLSSKQCHFKHAISVIYQSFWLGVHGPRSSLLKFCLSSALCGGAFKRRQWRSSSCTWGRRRWWRWTWRRRRPRRPRESAPRRDRRRSSWGCTVGWGSYNGKCCRAGWALTVFFLFFQSWKMTFFCIFHQVNLSGDRLLT